ncbi:MAG: hypothetical protein GC199_01235 [Alphaproteobacteria bacterium]|nr:hypothetical protein [Alphaproteobacteria bacterium]
MKIKIEVDLTPIEARRFLGLPDVEPMQDALMKQLQGQLSKSLTMMDPEQILKTWMPMGAQGLGEIQRMAWSAAQRAMGSSKKRSRTDPEAEDSPK